MNKVVSVRFQGANYMCVEGSLRARLLSQANSLWCSGDTSQWVDVFNLALTAPGCAFEERVMMSADPGLGAAYLNYADALGAPMEDATNV